MRNVSYKQDGKKLVITVEDCTTNIGPSSTGHTLLVASSGGAQPIAGFPGLKVSLLAYVPNPDAPAKAKKA